MHVHVLRRGGVCLKGRVLLRKHEKDGLTRFVHLDRIITDMAAFKVSAVCYCFFLLMIRLVFLSVLVFYISQEVKETKAFVKQSKTLS